MEKTEIFAVLEEVLELDEGTIKGGESLEALDWESISIVSFIALIDEGFDIVLSAAELVKCQTTDAIAELVMKAGS